MTVFQRDPEQQEESLFVCSPTVRSAADASGVVETNRSNRMIPSSHGYKACRICAAHASIQSENAAL